MALGMLMAIGAANGEDHPYDGPGADYQNNAPMYDQYAQNQYGPDQYGQGQYGQGQYGQSGYNSQYGSSSSSQVLTPPTSTYNNYNYYDWLSPGTAYWPYSYPAYYNYNYDNYWWYSHNPKYYYTTPIKHYYTWYPATYNWDPWYAANVYGFGSTTYYYSNRWSYHSGGFFFDP